MRSGHIPLLPLPFEVPKRFEQIQCADDYPFVFLILHIFCLLLVQLLPMTIFCLSPFFLVVSTLVIGWVSWCRGMTLFDWRKVIKRASVVFADNRVGYHLPYHKADQFYRGTDILVGRHDIADPVALLREYVMRRDHIHKSRAALFLLEDGSHPTRAWFDSKFFALLGREFGGHSIRAGGATLYASLGLSEDVIQAIGRWSSSAWKIYIRDNPLVRAELQLASLRAAGGHTCSGPLLIPASYDSAHILVFHHHRPPHSTSLRFFSLSASSSICIVGSRQREPCLLLLI